MGTFPVAVLVPAAHGAAPRGCSHGNTAVFEAGDLIVYTLAHRVRLRGEYIKLAPKEYDLLHVLARHAGRVITRQQILETVWGPANPGDLQYLRVFVRGLRQKIEVDPADPQMLPAEAGVGYRLVVPDPGFP